MGRDTLASSRAHLRPRSRDPRRRPPASAAAAGTDGPAHVLIFRSSGIELDALSARAGFFKPGWGPQIIGMLLDESVDRTELGELITESYCDRAPKKLIALLNRPE